MKKIAKIVLLVLMFTLVLAGCNKDDSKVTATIKEDSLKIGRSYISYTLNVNDPNAKDKKLNSKISSYVYEIVAGIEDEEDQLTLVKSKTITETVEEVKVEDLKETTNYKLVIKKTSGEEKNLYEQLFTTTNVGSVENPILVHTIEEFLKIEDDLTSYYKLESDLDFEGYKNENDESKLDSIGSSSRAFSGTFDGNGKTIKNVKNYNYSTSVYYYGIFAVLAHQGVIKNLNIDNVKFDTTKDDKLEQKSIEYLGILVGNNLGTIDNVKITNIDIKAGVSRSNSYVGGIVGVNDGIIKNSSIQGKMKIESSSSNIYAGGVCGMLAKDTDGKNREISNVSVDMDINVKTARNSVYVGGIAGESRGDIRNSYVVGKIEARTETTMEKDYKNVLNLGGLVGKHNKGYIINTYTEVELKATCTLAYEINVGGLVGKTGKNIIRNSISKSTVVLLFDTDKNLEAIYDAKNPPMETITNEDGTTEEKVMDLENKPTYSIGHIYGRNTDKIEIIENTFVLNDVTYNISTLETPKENVLASADLNIKYIVNINQLFSKNFYVDTLLWSNDIWKLDNLTKMPILR